MAKFSKGKQKTGGRKKGQKNKKTIEQEMALEFMRQRIREEWEGLIDVKIELAKGIWAERVIGGDLVKVFKEKPDGVALEYLFSMVVGKPKEAMDIHLIGTTKKLEDIQNKITKIADNIHQKAKENA
jgi:hypothetical protein